MDYVFFILVEAVLLAIAARSLTVLVHELGHAIPLMIFTGQKATIFLGSYGDKTGYNITLGLLEVWVSRDYLWLPGLCVGSGAQLTVNQHLWHIAGGVIAPGILAIAIVVPAFLLDINGAIQMFAFFFFTSAIIDLMANISAGDRYVFLANGNSVYGDIAEFKRVWKWRERATDYQVALNEYGQKNYARAANLFQAFHNDSRFDVHTYRILLYCYLQLNDKDNLITLAQQFSESAFRLTSNDYIYIANAYSTAGLNKESLDYFEKALAKSPRNVYALNGKGYTLAALLRYEESIEPCDQCIAIGGGREVQAYALNNRGFAKIKLDNLEEGFADLQQSLAMKPDNSYAVRNIGIYHLRRGEKDKAHDFFQKAKKMQPATLDIDALIDSAKA